MVLNGGNMAKKLRRVFIVPSRPGGNLGAYLTMFKKEGWENTEYLRNASLIQFVGGEDITPSFYGHHKYTKTNNNLIRDHREKLIYFTALKLKIPMIGICRGAHFLNVMNGGTLFQHILKHQHSHMALDLWDKWEINVSSIHHQEMIPSHDVNNWLLLMDARVSDSVKLKMTKENKARAVLNIYHYKRDIEALLYYDSLCVCFQPRPEFPNFRGCTKVYFKYINLII